MPELFEVLADPRTRDAFTRQLNAISLLAHVLSVGQAGDAMLDE